jgi:hypothetical protein
VPADVPVLAPSHTINTLVLQPYFNLSDRGNPKIYPKTIRMRRHG